MTAMSDTTTFVGTKAATIRQAANLTQRARADAMGGTEVTEQV
jgi:hypothetical protein